jgi:hypothetical protein
MRAIIAENAMSVAHGMAHPRVRLCGPRLREEEHHADVVYPEVQRVGDAVVRSEIEVRPHHGDHGADQQEQ